MQVDHDGRVLLLDVDSEVAMGMSKHGVYTALLTHSSVCDTQITVSQFEVPTDA